MSEVFEDQHCINCFIRFCVPVGFTEARRSDCKSFYCPNGHSMSYNKNDTPENVMRRERDRLAQRLAEKAARP